MPLIMHDSCLIETCAAASTSDPAERVLSMAPGTVREAVPSTGWDCIVADLHELLIQDLATEVPAASRPAARKGVRNVVRAGEWKALSEMVRSLVRGVVGQFSPVPRLVSSTAQEAARYTA